MTEPGLEIAVIGLVFLAPKIAFSWPSVDRFGKFVSGLMILGQVKSKARTDRDTGSLEPGSRPIFGSVSGSENQF